MYMINIVLYHSTTHVMYVLCTFKGTMNYGNLITSFSFLNPFVLLNLQMLKL